MSVKAYAGGVRLLINYLSTIGFISVNVLSRKKYRGLYFIITYFKCTGEECIENGYKSIDLVEEFIGSISIITRAKGN